MRDALLLNHAAVNAYEKKQWFIERNADVGQRIMRKYTKLKHYKPETKAQN